MLNVSALVKQGAKWASKNQAVLKAILASVGVVVTGVTAVRAGAQAKEVIDEREELEGVELDWTEKVRLTWPIFISPCVAGAASIFCIYSGTRVTLKRAMAISTLYSASQRELQMTKDAIVELEGPKAIKKVMDRVNEKKEETCQNKEVIFTGKGEHLCYDCQSGRYFKTDIESVRAAQNTVNKDAIGDNWASLNDLYFLLGLESIQIGDDIGWTYEHPLDIYFTSKLTEKEEPCLVMSYEVYPSIKW